MVLGGVGTFLFLIAFCFLSGDQGANALVVEPMSWNRDLSV